MSKWNGWNATAEKSLAFVAPSGENYLIFRLVKVCKLTVISPTKNYQNSLKHVLLQRKKLHWPRLIWATRYVARPCLTWRVCEVVGLVVIDVCFLKANDVNVMDLCQWLYDVTFCCWQPLEVELHYKQGRTHGLKAQVGIIGGVLTGFVTGIHKDSVRRWNLWFPWAAVVAEVLAGRATGTQITCYCNDKLLLIDLVYTCQKSFNFISAFPCYKQKCKLAPFNLGHPVCSQQHLWCCASSSPCCDVIRVDGYDLYIFCALVTALPCYGALEIVVFDWLIDWYCNDPSVAP